MTISDSLTIHQLPGAPLGATVTMPSYTTDPSKLNEEDFAKLKKGLLTYSVLVVPNQADLPPESQYALTVRFDPSTSTQYGHDEKIFHSSLSVLAKDGKCVPRRPEVMMVGNGTFPAGHEGMKEFTLLHPSQSVFHKKTLTDEEIAQHHTRFYRWHIDAALYEFSPPVVTTLLGVIVPPKSEKQVITYEDSDERLEVSTGATAFASGKTAFDLLSDEDKQFALNTTVVYAPHPYIFIHEAKATSDGLTMVSEGKEMSLDELPKWEESKIKKLPMVWTNPITGNPHLQFHSCCVYKLVDNKTGKTIADLEKAREICHRLIRPAISPKYVYAHAWNKGDLCIFHNRGVIHSVTGEMPAEEKRLMHQCNVASGEDPI
ncbi:DEKNAAC102319 [Brettanomyces naardenensis]|uniref:DEKNAAC102319 n=1 Tax=Brettanomyces naardenensis TaxID=13370 RepID=A0A448YLG5_BRENA|nr:DEKNAAC102319 [Brettanomyces naardenensis]